MRRTLFLCLFAVIASCGTDKQSNPQPGPSPEPGPESTYHKCEYTFVPKSAPNRKTVVTLVVDGSKARATSSYEINNVPAIVSMNSRNISEEEDCVVLDVSHYSLVFHKSKRHAHFYNAQTQEQANVECEAK